MVGGRGSDILCGLDGLGGLDFGSGCGGWGGVVV